nr:hypothetical protein [Tanacetum cinerariifolium]
MSFSKRPEKNTPQCYTKPLDSLKNWNNRFFWVDERVFSTVVDWRTNAPKDGMPAVSTYSIEAVRALDTHRTPIQKQPEMLLCLVGISRRYYLGDEVYGSIQFNSCPKSYEGEDWKPPTRPHEVPLLTLTATRVIEMDDLAAATDSSGVPSTIEKSPLDFADEAGVSDQGTVAPEMPPSKDVPATDAPGASQAEEVVALDPPADTESRKRGRDGTDGNAPPKSLRRDHADPRPTGSSHGGKSLAAIQLGLRLLFLCLKMLLQASSQGTAAAGDLDSENASSHVEVGSPKSIYRPEWGVANGSLLDTPEACQDLVDHVAPPGYFSELRHMHNDEFLRQYNVNLARQVAMGSQLRLMFEQEAMLMRKSVAQVARRDKRIQAQELEIKKTGSTTEDRGRYEEGHERQECRANPRTRRYACSVLGSPGEQRASISAGCYPTRAGIAKGMSEGLRHGVEHGQSRLNVESIEAYDPEAEAKFFAALQALKDLKYPLVDQLEGLKDAPMDVIIAALYLESDTGGDAPQYIRDLCLNSSQLTIPVFPESCREEKKCRIVCRTHRVGSAHHARSDAVPVSVPTVVPQGLALLLADATTQTEFDT